MVKQIQTKLGELVAEWRKKSSLSQAALGDALGVQQAAISRIESGRCRLSVIQLVSILDACGLSLGEVADDIEEAMEGEGKPLWERVNE